MKRHYLSKLKAWSESAERVPLLIRGARQVGKSWGVRQFGQQFPHFIELNFEKSPSLKHAFTGDINIKQLIERLSLYAGQVIKPGETLLFLDEIQECQAALNYLRYFKEELPELHVIAAGSLLDFMLTEIGMPVGRVDYLFVTPLSFAEFLQASGRDDLRAVALNEQHDPLLQQTFMEYLRTYLWLGGMPAVVDAWLKSQDPGLCQKIQDRIIATYQDDFAKYAKSKQMPYVEKVFNNIPLQLGAKFMFTRLDPDLRAAPLKAALDLLIKAGIAHLCYHTSGQKPPLAAGINEKFFKAFFLDIGLVQRLLGLTQKNWLLEPLCIDNLGAITEQFVAQELIAYTSAHQSGRLFYWRREQAGAQAEIDFLLSKADQIIPIEVKAGKTGRLKSLQVYLQSHPHCAYGLKISEQAYAEHDPVIQIPLYGIEQWLRQEAILA